MVDLTDIKTYAVLSCNFSGRTRGAVLASSGNLFGPVKPFLVQLYLKTERCIRLKLLVSRERLFIFKICE